MSCYNCGGCLESYRERRNGLCDDCARIGDCGRCGKETIEPRGCERCGHGDGTDYIYNCDKCSVGVKCSLCGKQGDFCCFPEDQFEEKHRAKPIPIPTACCGSFFCEPSFNGPFGQGLRDRDRVKNPKKCVDEHKTKLLACGHIGCNKYPELGDFEGNSGDKKCRVCDIKQTTEIERSRLELDIGQAKELLEQKDNSKLYNDYLTNFVKEAEGRMAKKEKKVKKTKSKKGY